MDKARSDKPVILLLFISVVRIHHEGGHDRRSLKSVEAHQCGHADNDIREIQKKMDYVSGGKHKQFTFPKDVFVNRNYIRARVATEDASPLSG